MAKYKAIAGLAFSGFRAISSEPCACHRAKRKWWRYLVHCVLLRADKADRRVFKFRYWCHYGRGDLLSRQSWSFCDETILWMSTALVHRQNTNSCNMAGPEEYVILVILEDSRGRILGQDSGAGF